MSQLLSKPDDDAQETLAAGVMCGDILRIAATTIGAIINDPGVNGDYLRTPVNQFVNGERDIDYKVPAGHSRHPGRTILTWVISRNEEYAWAIVDISDEFDPADSQPGQCGLVGGRPEDILSPDLLQRSVTKYGGATS